MNWLDGNAYADQHGRMYKVMPNAGTGNLYRARYCKPHTSGWYAVRTLPWRPTVMEAQRDLDELARRKGWKNI